MAEKGNADIAIWEGASLWLVDVRPKVGARSHVTDLHSHHAVQITLSLGGRIELRGPAGAIAGNAVVAADAEHLLEAEGRIAVLFVEPESAPGRAIMQKRLGAARLAALPSEPIADLVDALGESGAHGFETIGRALVARLGANADTVPLDRRVEKMIAHAAAHLDGKVGLASAASAASLSSGRARHLFVEQTGLPFRTYLLWLRIMKAVEHYASGDSLTEAALAAGFADSAHLSRTFRRMFGISAASLRIS